MVKSAFFGKFRIIDRANWCFFERFFVKLHDRMCNFSKYCTMERAILGFMVKDSGLRVLSSRNLFYAFA